MMNIYNTTTKQKNVKNGFVLLLSVLIVSITLGIGLSLFTIIIKSLRLSSGARESLFAVYAADTGIECALFWDVRGHEAGYYGSLVFPTSTESTPPPPGSNINCLGVDITTIPFPWDTTDRGANYAYTRFVLNLGDRCTVVEVGKFGPPPIQTSILSRGYNATCNAGGPIVTSITVERTIRVTY